MTEDDVIKAGELALGVLDGEERAAALRQVLAEPAFAAEVTRWRRQLAGLISSFPDVAPPTSLAHEVTASIAPRQRSAGGWRVAAIGLSAVAASLVAIIAWPRHDVGLVAQPVPASVLVAALAGQGGKPFNAVYDPNAARVSVVGAAAWAADRSAELWVIAPGKPPRPLGMLTRGERSSVAIPAGERLAMATGATLAVSIEPDGGSPTGLPTGPVVASGALVAG